MTTSTINFETVKRIGLDLPRVEESTAYGMPALKVNGKLLAAIPANRSAEPGSLMVRVAFDDRAELLTADPDAYYVTNHYIDYEALLVRLTKINPDILRDLLAMAHKFVTRKVTPRPSAKSAEALKPLSQTDASPAIPPAPDKEDTQALPA